MDAIIAVTEEALGDSFLFYCIFCIIGSTLICKWHILKYGVESTFRVEPWNGVVLGFWS